MTLAANKGSIRIASGRKGLRGLKINPTQEVKKKDIRARKILKTEIKNKVRSQFLSSALTSAEGSNTPRDLFESLLCELEALGNARPGLRALNGAEATRFFFLDVSNGEKCGSDAGTELVSFDIRKVNSGRFPCLVSPTCLGVLKA